MLTNFLSPLGSLSLSHTPNPLSRGRSMVIDSRYSLWLPGFSFQEPKSLGEWHRPRICKNQEGRKSGKEWEQTSWVTLSFAGCWAWHLGHLSITYLPRSAYFLFHTIIINCKQLPWPQFISPAPSPMPMQLIHGTTNLELIKYFGMLTY